MIIGLTSMIASGKGEFCSYLADKGFTAYSLSDAIREELLSQGKEITRDSLRTEGNQLRHKRGPDVLAKRMIEKIKGRQGSFILESIRNPAEVETLRREIKGFVLIFIDAPLETRFERAKKRNREKDGVTLEEFKDKEEKEKSATDSAAQQLHKCQEMADLTIKNDSTLEIFHKRIDELLKKIEREKIRK
jgi:dephospho-CoA kinase